MQINNKRGYNPSRSRSHSSESHKRIRRDSSSEKSQTDYSKLPLYEIFKLSEDILNSSQVQTHLKTLQDDPHLSEDDAWKILYHNPKAEGQGIKNGIFQMSPNRIFHTNAIHDHPYVNAYFDQLQDKADLPSYDVRDILNVRPSSKGIGINHGISEMDVYDMYNYIPWEDIEDSHPVRQTAKQRLNILQDDPHLSLGDGFWLLKFRPAAQGKGIDKIASELSCQMIEELDPEVLNHPRIQERWQRVGPPYETAPELSFAQAKVERQGAEDCIYYTPIAEIKKPVFLKTNDAFHLFDYDSLKEHIEKHHKHPLLLQQSLTLEMLKRKGVDRILWKAKKE